MRHEERQNARAILAANVETLIRTLGGGTQMGLVRAIRVPQKTISRTKNDENAANLDTVNDIARGTGLQPWQLLVPGLDPAHPPEITRPPLHPQPSIAETATAQGGRLARLRKRGSAVQPRIGPPARRSKERKTAENE